MPSNVLLVSIHSTNFNVRSELPAPFNTPSYLHVYVASFYENKIISDNNSTKRNLLKYLPGSITYIIREKHLLPNQTVTWKGSPS